MARTNSEDESVPSSGTVVSFRPVNKAYARYCSYPTSPMKTVSDRSSSGSVQLEPLLAR